MSSTSDHVCRLCISSEVELLPIFPTTSTEASGPSVLVSKIQACVDVQIKTDDVLPTSVCRKCLDNVNNWYIFKKVCERAQAKLETLFNKDGSQLDDAIKIKCEPLVDEAYDDGVVIDGSYPEFEQNAVAEKVQPEGPPILASLGLTPKSDKGAESDKDEGEEDDEEDDEDQEDKNQSVQRFTPKIPIMPEVSVTVMRPTGETLHARQGIQQLASKTCLVCGRSYRYSHNARRHELMAHSFDRYTNKVTKKPTMTQKLMPNPFNPKSRLMPNPVNPKMQFMPRTRQSHLVNIPKPNPKVQSKPVAKNNLPYPLRIKALKDLQIKKTKEPQILKSLLTATPEVLVSEPEIMNSRPESPETLTSEPDISSFQVETILSEPDAFEHDDEHDDDGHVNSTYDTVDMESEHEIEIARQAVINEDDQIDEVNPNDTMDETEEIGEPDTFKDDNETAEINDSEIIEGDRTEQDLTEKEMNDPDNEVGTSIIENDAEESVRETEKQMKKEVDSLHNESVADDNVEDQHATENDQDEEINVGADDDDYEMPNIAPIVEINEGPQNSCSTELEEEDEETIAEPEMDLAVDVTGKPLDPNKQYLTETQRKFVSKYRDIIEQINTKKCLCCNREYPRRKAVIQHLQKNGHLVPKHTCYNCIVTFPQIGALLSHMRADVCTNLWKVIYRDDGIPDDLIIDEPKEELPGGLNKVQYKDILNSRSYACKLCPAKFQLKQFIMKHVLDVHEDGQSRVPLACVHCGYRFKENRLWKKHIRNGECTVHIACDLCPEKFNTILDFNDHVIAVHAGSFGDQANDSQNAKPIDGRPTDCPICQKACNNYHNLVKHLKGIHNEEQPHYCQHCDAKFEVITDLNNHIYKDHSDRSLAAQSIEPDMSLVKEEAEEYHYSCTECNSIFETVDAWTDHQVAEHNQIAHHCDQCEKKFLRPSELAEHKNTHLRARFYACNVCSNTYGTPQKLAEHLKVAHPCAPDMTSVLEFYCEICIRNFKSRQAYSNHMRIHAKVPTTNRKPGQVKETPSTIIGKPIRQAASLNQTGYVNFKSTPVNVPAAPYCCDICGKGFMHKKNIWKHKKVLHADVIGGDKVDFEENTMHASTEGEEEYQHDENGGLSIPQFDSFNFSNYVASKPPVVQTQQPPADSSMFACDMCHKKFPLRSSLYKHKRAKHGIVNASANLQVNSQAGAGPSESAGSRSSCTICKISFSDKKSYYRHRKNVHKSSVQMCKICGKPLSSTLELYEHLKSAHARELLGYNSNQVPKDLQPKVEYDYAGEEQETDLSEYQARYPCDNCGKQFLGLLALQNHQCVTNTTSSSQGQTFDCEICNKSYTSIAALKSHRGWHLRSPDGKAAANNSGLWMPQHRVTNKHSKYEVGPDVKISTVPAIATAKRRLPPEVEVTVVNPNKKMRSDDNADVESQGLTGSETDDKYCTICDKEFTKRAAYQRHLEEVHQPNSVFCPVCEKSFTRKSTLLIHMRKHYDEGEGERAQLPLEGESVVYTCDLCGAEFGTGKALRVHKARHHGEQDSSEEEAAGGAGGAGGAPPGEFTCGQCGEGVATPRDLLAHRTVHATPSKFYCHICKVYFSRAQDLSAHTRHKHNDSDKVFFPCAMCDRFYMNKKSLQRHIEMSH